MSLLEASLSFLVAGMSLLEEGMFLLVAEMFLLDENDSARSRMSLQVAGYLC